MSKNKTKKSFKSNLNCGSSSVDDIIESSLDEKVMLTIKTFEHIYELSPITTTPYQFLSGINNKFITYESALEFIAIHCFRVHRKFTRDLSRLYIPWCFVFDIHKKKYVLMGSLSKEKFNRVFQRVEKTFSKFQSLQ
jgi:hypothetical protein